MASRPWADEDRAFLERLSERRDWIDAAVARFPNRSEAALRCMMQKVRLEQGRGDTRFVDSPWMANAVQGSHRLLEALQLAGLRPQ